MRRTVQVWITGFKTGYCPPMANGASFEPAPGRTFYLGIKMTLRQE